MLQPISVAAPSAADIGSEREERDGRSLGCMEHNWKKAKADWRSEMREEGK